MAVNIKKLAIVTTAYTGVLLTQDSAGVIKYLQDKGVDISSLNEIASMKDEIRPLIRDELFSLWGLAEEARDAVSIDDEMLTVSLGLEPQTLQNIRDYAMSKGLTVEMAIEQQLENAFAGLKIEV